MADRPVLKGKVVGGSRQAAFFTQIQWVQDQCAEKLGFAPFPGTLNVELAPESRAEALSLAAGGGVELVSENLSGSLSRRSKSACASSRFWSELA